MSEQQNLDLSKVISLIMENPALVEQISNLAKSQTKQSETSLPAEQAEETISQEQVEEPKTAPTYAPIMNHRNNRSELLCALKPYVSKERAKAIDSMISIVDILDMMKAR
jgi:hypothetical protein